MKIRTINDIFNTINADNVENFIIGFGASLRSYVKIVDLTRDEYRKIGIDLSKTKNTDILKQKHLTYIDDDKQENGIIIHLG